VKKVSVKVAQTALLLVEELVAYLDMKLAFGSVDLWDILKEDLLGVSSVERLASL